MHSAREVLRPATQVTEGAELLSERTATEEKKLNKVCSYAQSSHAQSFGSQRLDPLVQGVS